LSYTGASMLVILKMNFDSTSNKEIDGFSVIDSCKSN